jgi:SAM-dependent methyltransferase
VSSTEPAEHLPEHVAENRRYWDDHADEWVARGEVNWGLEQPTWGEWDLPEAELRLLPEDMTGRDAIELGCGTGYVSGWMARRGARVVGIDGSERQLATARRLAAEHGADITLLHGNAETVPYPDASFDFAISEYGAAIWCDPFVWIPEAHRLLRPGGALVFLGNGPLSMVCMPLDGSIPVSDRLQRDYFALYRLDWRDAVDDPGGVEFNLPISRWMRLFRDTGFVVEDYLELQCPATTTESPAHLTADWGRRYPAEQVWKLRKRVAGAESPASTPS